MDHWTNCTQKQPMTEIAVSWSIVGASAGQKPKRAQSYQLLISLEALLADRSGLSSH